MNIQKTYFKLEKTCVKLLYIKNIHVGHTNMYKFYCKNIWKRE